MRRVAAHRACDLLLAFAMVQRAASIHDQEAEEVRPPSEPSAVSAAERAVEAAQRIAVERLELMRLEVMDALAAIGRRAGLLLGAGFIALLGWSGLAVALVLELADVLELSASIAIVAGAHVLVGIAIGLVAIAGGRGTTRE
jgi:hypothetical protein